VAELKPLVLDGGKVSQLKDGDVFDSSADYCSGTSYVPTGKLLVVSQYKQMTVFNEFILDGTLNLDGDLWLA